MKTLVNLKTLGEKSILDGVYLNIKNCCPPTHPPLSLLHYKVACALHLPSFLYQSIRGRLVRRPSQP